MTSSELSNEPENLFDFVNVQVNLVWMWCFHVFVRVCMCVLAGI